MHRLDRRHLYCHDFTFGASFVVRFVKNVGPSGALFAVAFRRCFRRFLAADVEKHSFASVTGESHLVLNLFTFILRDVLNLHERRQARAAGDDCLLTAAELLTAAVVGAAADGDVTFYKRMDTPPSGVM